MLTKTDVILDTNVLIYALDATSPFHADAMALLHDPSLNFFLASKNVSEYFAVCSKVGIDFAKAFGFYRQICQNALVLFPDSTSLAVFEKLLQKYQPKGNRVFDIEIVSVAVANHIPEVATVNVKDFSGVSEITVRPL